MNDPCINASSPYVPSNITRITNLPSEGFSRIALVPWISGDCARAYLGAADREEASALIFYLAKDVVLSNQTAAAPPDDNSPAWLIDGTLGWQSSIDFPAYAINADEGSLVMGQLSQYPGNLSQAPHAEDLLARYSREDRVQLYCNINATDSSELPSLWVFLLVIIGMLGAMIFVTSLGMHIIQRRRRQRIRELLSSGQVDLPSLGIRLLTIPRDVIDSFPLFVYHAAPEESEPAYPAESKAPASGSDEPPTKGPSIDSDPKADLDTHLPPPSTLPHRTPNFPQPTCPICLDDFLTDETIVRTLPCHHIFHPACIDPMLSEYSTLCPLCKSSALPERYCPQQITNSMLRQQRAFRGQRRTNASRSTSTPSRQPPPTANLGAFSIRNLCQRRTSPADGRSRLDDAPHELEMGRVQPRESSDTMMETVPEAAAAARPPSVPRSEWARHRASAFFGREARADVAGGGNAATVPRCTLALTSFEVHN